MTKLSIASLFMTVVIVGQTAAISLRDDRSFVITGSNSANDVLSRSKRHTSTGSSIKSLRVTSVIVSRFARVTFVNKMENNDDFSKDMVFSVRLPTAAFITEFNMVVGGVTFVGKVKEKEQAKAQFDRAVERGNSAGLVVADVRETQTFDVSANVPANSSVEFHLVYQQLLNRKIGEYQHAIMINPRQVIDDFGVDVYITETSGITSLSTENPGGKGGARSKGAKGQDDEVVEITTDIRRSRSQAKVSFTPTSTEKRLFLALPEDEQKFTVNYDVTRESLGGEITMRNGYFVHFFAPENLPVLPMRVVFVIDRSGSMYGRKIDQTKRAFASIIKELRDSDKFNIVSFSGDVTSWKPGLVDVTKGSVNGAIDHVEEIVASGGTNLNGAVLKAAEMLNEIKIKGRESAMIILLTDGQPTSGVTDTAQIRLNAKKTIAGKYSLFCLGFGDNLNHDFLKRLASENDGIARKIYEASDAELQLKGFFQEVATPLLLNVKITYSGANVTDLSQTDFTKYFGGSETIVVGTYDSDGKNKLRSHIKGKSNNGRIHYKAIGKEMSDTFQHWYQDTGDFDDFIERLWAYFTITDLLEKKTISQDRLEIQKLTGRVIQLALKYHFVTPLTSLVVTLPKDEMPTTTTGPFILTPIPPLPPCYMRGVPVPRRILHPIWCPIILDPTLVARSSSESSSARGLSAPPKQSSSQRIIGGSPSQFGLRRRPASSHRGMAFSSGGQRSLAGSMPTYNPCVPNPCQNGACHGGGNRRRYSCACYAGWEGANCDTQFVWNECSEKFTGSSATMQLPGTLGTQIALSCRKEIVLKKNMWIDFHIEIANTTRNQVVITSKGQTVFSHERGVSSPRYIYLEHNEAEVKFTVYADDAERPGIVISYQEFSPDKKRSTPTPVLKYNPNFSMINCGGNISFSEASSGVIASPNYPQMYPDGAHCLWNLVDDLGDRLLKIRFVDVDIESSVDGNCTHDKLIIIQGDEEHHVICGYKLPSDMMITSKMTKIVFVSDDALGAAGFKLQYEFIS